MGACKNLKYICNAILEIKKSINESIKYNNAGILSKEVFIYMILCSKKSQVVINTSVYENCISEYIITHLKRIYRSYMYRLE